MFPYIHPSTCLYGTIQRNTKTIHSVTFCCTTNSTCITYKTTLNVGFFLMISSDLIQSQLLLEFPRCIQLSPQPVSSHLMSSHLMFSQHSSPHFISPRVFSPFILILILAQSHLQGRPMGLLCKRVCQGIRLGRTPHVASITFTTPHHHCFVCINM